MQEWNISLVIQDGFPCTQFDWRGKAATRDDAIAQARQAYPDPVAKWHVYSIKCYPESIPAPGLLFGGLN